MIFTLISVNTFNKADKNLFGYKFFVVQTDSMSATHFNAGDVIISKYVDLTTLKPGDVITFVSQNPDSRNQTITHMIRDVTRDANGQIAFVTYGTTTGVNDDALATMVIGKYQAKIPKIGYFFQFLKTTPGYIVCILVPFLLLTLSQGVNCIRLFKRYKAEQMESLQQERVQLENEREESRRMMEELMALKEQIAKKEAEAVTATPAPQTSTPVAETVAEPVAETVAEPVAETVAEPVAETVAEPVAETVAEPVSETVAEPVAETVAEPVAEESINN